MPKKSEPKKSSRDDQTEYAGDSTAALGKVIEALNETSRQLENLIRSGFLGDAPVVQAAAPAGAIVNSWNDPFSEATPTVNPPLSPVAQLPVATNNNPRMRTTIAEPAPAAALYNPGTPGFRYWLAVEAVARGIKFWDPLLPAGTTWSTSNPMRIALVAEGEDLNARYFRQLGLRFYRRKVESFDIHSCESPDVVCHELGHAVLDALRPQLFNAASTESSAFHEAFGDMSAILCALQVRTFREGVIAETSGRLNVNSRLSRLAEQLGWAIRQFKPTTVDRDCLRNAANRFFYRSPDAVPPKAPANLISSEGHSFSRIFTGAFLDALARAFNAADGSDEAALHSISADFGQLLVDAVLAASIVPAYFSQVAAAMVQADAARFGRRYRSALAGAFLERGILSIESTLTLSGAPVPAVVSHDGGARGIAAEELATTLRYEGAQPDESYRLSLGQTAELPRRRLALTKDLTIEVHAPEETPRFAVASAALGAADDSSLGLDADVKVFVKGLIQRGQISGQVKDFAGIIPEASESDLMRETHSLVTKDGGALLVRDHFDCGFCQYSASAVER